MAAGKGIGGHHSAASGTNEWMTPPHILSSLGEFDLDPASPIVRPWDTAKKHYNKIQNGLLQKWQGRVFLNPPYTSAELVKFMAMMAEHGDGVALIFARTDTNTFHNYVFEKADSLFFIKQRLTFLDVEGNPAPHNSGAPSVLIAYGERNVDALEDCGLEGRHVPLNSVPMIVVGMHDTWKAVITVALTRLDGEAPVNRIYEVVERIAPQMVSKNKNYKEKIRQRLQQYFPKIRRGVYVLELDERNN